MLRKTTTGQVDDIVRKAISILCHKIFSSEFRQACLNEKNETVCLHLATCPLMNTFIRDLLASSRSYCRRSILFSKQLLIGAKCLEKSRTSGSVGSSFALPTSTQYRLNAALYTSSKPRAFARAITVLHSFCVLSLLTSYISVLVHQILYPLAVSNGPRQSRPVVLLTITTVAA
jgi:hypothetical protein